VTNPHRPSREISKQASEQAQASNLRGARSFCPELEPERRSNDHSMGRLPRIGTAGYFFPASYGVEAGRQGGSSASEGCPNSRLARGAIVEDDELRFGVSGVTVKLTERRRDLEYCVLGRV
jgi:hypothetical protein